MKLKNLSREILKCSKSLIRNLNDVNQDKNLCFLDTNDIIDNVKINDDIYIFNEGYGLHYQYLNGIPTFPSSLWLPSFIFPFNSIIEQNFKKEKLKILAKATAFKIDQKTLKNRLLKIGKYKHYYLNTMYCLKQFILNL
ncbi:hypothetical protein AZF37_08040 [endosymbiont 'TC1' of Trimyema compressum]|uniref:hypothetical protein n=1 Tax=endosymbiont 'TC1' of Trimyema compressum TaxID=243899 RepID=UPI0007F0BD3A|nr:hypothetical protein [endosymbiont 'TC1' of Trimyema compressum]AMP21113.1 hypothetical protein AZF37_08040 [endosymbiont 'TC1' of Trimyema compressum]